MQQIRASHVLVDTENEAKEIKAMLDSGKAFDQLAGVYSRCPSGKDGGDLGWFTPGMMVEEFEKAAFLMEEGEIVGPIQTRFGYHLILLTGKKLDTLRVLITSDLHYGLTGSEPIRRLVAGMDRENPDLVVIAGDLGRPSSHFEECLRCFMKLDAPVAVVPGNHDIWNSPGETSVLLYEELLPAITRDFHFHWLEREPLILKNGTAICGSLGWYDYSARDPRLAQSDEEIIANKAKYAADALYVNWEYSDREFAERCRNRLTEQVAELEKNPDVSKILVVTHVPCFEAQIERSEDDNWARGTPYFGHHTMGECLSKFGKVRWVVSGHTHIGMNGIVERPDAPPIATAVVGSDYGRPRWVTLEV